MSRIRRCLYEELGVARNADDAELKRAYRTAALAHHPDKNRGGGEQEAAERFKAIQHAYEVLSDPHERAWYDSHREAILHGRDPASSTDASAADATEVDLFAYFTSSAYAGFDGAPGSFYSVYSEVFSTLAAEERACGASHPNPVFGGPDAEWDSVRDFYRTWDGFSSRKMFGSADKWNLSEGPNRDYRRAMEKENKRERAKAKKEFNALVRDLVFVKKRDPRVKAKRDSEEELKSERERLAKAREILDKAEREARAADVRAQRDELLDEDGDALDEILAQLALDEELDTRGRRRIGRMKSKTCTIDSQSTVKQEDADGCEVVSNQSNTDNDAFGNAGPAGRERGTSNDLGDESADIEEEDDELIDGDALYCIACHKAFRSRAQKENHEVSKKHLAMSKKLRSRLEKEEERLQRVVDKPVSTRPGAEQNGSYSRSMDSEEGVAVDSSRQKKKRRKRPSPAVGSSAFESSEDERPKIDESIASNSPSNLPSIDTSAHQDGIMEDDVQTDKSVKAERRMKRREKRKAKAASEVQSVSGRNELRCNVCNAEFQSRNRLMTHVKEKGHALYV